MKGHRQLVQMSIEPRTNPVDDLLGGAREQVVLVVVREPANDAGDNQNQSRRSEDLVRGGTEDREGSKPRPVRVLVEEHLVEHDLKWPRFGDAGERIHEPERHPADEPAALPPHIRRERADNLTGLRRRRRCARCAHTRPSRKRVSARSRGCGLRFDAN